VAAVAALAAV